MKAGAQLTFSFLFGPGPLGNHIEGGFLTSINLNPELLHRPAQRFVSMVSLGLVPHNPSLCLLPGIGQNCTTKLSFRGWIL